jgi:hypothetical protein
MGDFKKGDLARTVVNKDIGREGGTPRGVRVLTQAELDRMQADPWWQGLDCAGEPRIIPSCRSEKIDAGLIVTVVRARAKAPSSLGWGKWSGGHVLVLDTKSGHEYYIKRHFLEAVQE